MIRCMDCMNQYEALYEVCPHCGFLRGTPPDVAYHLHPGTVLHSRYIVGTVVGYGGFGIVYKAWDQQRGALVAIKEHYPNGLLNRIPGTAEVMILKGGKEQQYHLLLSRFMDEAKIMSKFSNHPNIAHVYDLFEANQTAYIVMEFLDGVNLKQFVRQNENNRMPLQMAIETVVEVSKILEEMHKLGFVHRDISLDNIHLCQNGVVKIYDLGTARLARGDISQDLSVIVKPGFAPPEQYRATSKQGAFSDVYALSAVLYRISTGVMPLESTDRVVSDSLEIPSHLNAEIPEWLDRAILSGMAITPEVRTQNMLQFRENLLRPSARLKYPKERIRQQKRRRMALGLAAIFVLLCVMGTGLYAYLRNIGTFIPNGSIEMWLPASNGEPHPGYEAAAAAFSEKYPGKEITFQWIDEGQYGNALLDAQSDDALPALLIQQESTEIPGQLSDRFWQSLTYLDYAFLPQQLNALMEANVVPLGFETPVVYINTHLQKTLADPLPDAFEAASFPDALQSHFRLDPDTPGAAALSKAIDRSPDPDAKEAFLAETVIYYIGSSSQLAQVQEAHPGYTDVVPIYVQQQVIARFSNCCVIPAGTDENTAKIAEAFLQFLLSEQGQTILCVQHNTTFPLQYQALSVYLPLHTNLNFFEDNLSNVTMLPLSDTP